MSKRRIEQERAEFELWMRKHRPYESLHRKFKNDPYSPGVQCYWEAWQARAATEADRKRRGEPVAWVSEQEIPEQMVDGRPRRVWWECNEGVGFPIYRDAQPAEPVKVRPETLSEHIARDIREGRFPDKSDRKMVPAEPVKVPSDTQESK